MADDNDDGKRELFIKRYMYALSKAMDEGVDVLGYTYWSYLDNFEWDKGYVMKFGLNKVDLSSQERSFRLSSQFYIDIINQFHKK
jgi:beta-glucosidase